MSLDVVRSLDKNPLATDWERVGELRRGEVERSTVAGLPGTSGSTGKLGRAWKPLNGSPGEADNVEWAGDGVEGGECATGEGGRWDPGEEVKDDGGLWFS